jgi:hypothetical protein
VHTTRDRIAHLDPAAMTRAFRFARALAERIDHQIGLEQHDGSEDREDRADPGAAEQRQIHDRGDRTDEGHEDSVDEVAG